MRKLLYQSILAASCVYLYSGSASAACTQNPTNRMAAYIPNNTLNIQYDNTWTNNYVIATHSIAAFPGLANYNFANANAQLCGGYQDLYYVNSWNGNASKIAPTGISGIGIRVRLNTFGSSSYIPIQSQKTDTSWGFGSVSWVVDIIKTGAITTSGTIRSGEVAYLTQQNTAVGTRFVGSILRFQSNYQIKVLSCSLKSPVPTINLGDWYDTQFPAIGSTSTEVDIPITLTCFAGTNIKATIAATSGIINAPQGQLALSGGTNKATGVAIQIVDANRNPIPLNSKRTIRDNAAEGNYIFGWKARYIKTTDKITPGPANGTATINIRYE